MTAVLTTVGATLMAQSFAANTSVPVTSVRVGSLAPAMRYDATPSPTGTRLQGLLDHTPRILALPNITLLSNMGVVQIDISDEDLTAVYDADEIAFMSGATPVFLVAQASGPYYRKVANASALFSLNFEIAGMAATSLTVSVPSFVFATQAQALARTAANVMMSPLRVADAMGRTIVLPRELPTGANLNLFDNADHYGFWYRNSPTGIQNLPAGITAGQLNLEVMQNGPVSPGVSRVTQRLTVSTADDVRLFVRDSYDGEDLFNEWREMGKPVDHQVFTANGTWTKPAGVKTDSVVKVQMWGGGGSGCTGGGSNSSGAGGGYSEFQFLASDLPATVPVTVGASHPGTTGNGSVSNVGNDSTFGTYQHARGGGRRYNGTTSPHSWLRGGGHLTGNDFLQFQGGNAGRSPDSFSIYGGGGGSDNTSPGLTSGGVSMLGGNGGDANPSGAGGDGHAPGGGGARGTTVGGAGARGEVRVTTFF